MAVDHLAEERATAQFDVETMKVYLAGGQREHDIGQKMAQLVANDPVSIIAISCVFGWGYYNLEFAFVEDFGITTAPYLGGIR